jgi:uncharacterized membrane protein YfbV (UPF0208 family)
MDAPDLGIFDDLVAQDVRESFAAALAAGLSPEQATLSVLEAFEDILPDPEEGPSVWLALAALQLEIGCLTEQVRLRALEAMETDLLRWAMESPEALAQRQQELAPLRSRLTYDETEQQIEPDWEY